MQTPPAMADESGPDLAGRVVLNRYRLDSELGRGSIGVVYRATELATGRAVAAKVMRTELREARGVVARFLREARVARRLEHPAIPRGLAAGLGPLGAPVLVMEFVAGEDLRQRFERVGPLPVDEVLSVALGTAEALAYAHAQRVVHRDVKPGNLMFAGGETSPGAVRVLDFGLSFCLDEPRLTTAVTLVGTPAYMAPEQARGEAATPAADVYSLAATLVHLATGATLFEGPWLAQIDAHARAPLPDLRARRPDLPPAFASLLASMLEKDALRRPADARMIAAALHAMGAPDAQASVSGVAPRGDSAEVAPLHQRLRALRERHAASRATLLREIVAVGERRVERESVGAQFDEAARRGDERACAVLRVRLDALPEAAADDAREDALEAALERLDQRAHDQERALLREIEALDATVPLD